MPHNSFVIRHIGPRKSELTEMLEAVGVSTMEELIEQTVPSDIRLKEPLKLQEGISERKYYRKILKLAIVLIIVELKKGWSVIIESPLIQTDCVSVVQSNSTLASTQDASVTVTSVKIAA